MKITNELFCGFLQEFIGPDLSALNTTIFEHSTPNNIIGKGYCASRSQMSFFSWFKKESIGLEVRALNASIFVHSTPNNIIGKGYCAWRSQMSYLADLSTTP